MGTNRQVLMAKEVATKWLESNMVPEYRLTVYLGGDSESLNIPAIVRVIRKRKTKITKDGPYPDLSMQAGFDFFILKSKDKQPLLDLEAFFSRIGLETFGILGLE